MRDTNDADAGFWPWAGLVVLVGFLLAVAFYPLKRPPPTPCEVAVTDASGRKVATLVVDGLSPCPKGITYHEWHTTAQPARG
jgi:hypothetical protein